MITLYRRIRQRLISSGSVTKYLLYAVGEIFLVMIGILLALQVNNWNEDKQLESQELNLLQEITENLAESKIDIERMVSSNQERVDGYAILLSHLEAQKPEHDSLYKYFRRIYTWASPYLTFTAYETLKQKGIDIIQNESLRKKITNMYEAQFADLIYDWDRSEWLLNEAVVTPYFNEHFEILLTETYEETGLAVPHEYEALVQDPEFKNMLTRLVILHSSGNERGKVIMENIHALTREIEQELLARGYHQSHN